MFGQRNMGGGGNTGAAAAAAPGEKLIEDKPGFLILLQVWWAIIWRQMLWFFLVLVVFFIVSFVLGMIFTMIGGDRDILHAVLTPIGAFVGLAGGFWAFMKAFRQVLGQTFSGHRLVFLTPSVAGRI